jgi:hypothetical protein
MTLHIADCDTFSTGPRLPIVDRDTPVSGLRPPASGETLWSGLCIKIGDGPAATARGRDGNAACRNALSAADTMRLTSRSGSVPSRTECPKQL